jgi:hypothetical protein
VNGYQFFKVSVSQASGLSRKPYYFDDVFQQPKSQNVSAANGITFSKPGSERWYVDAVAPDGIYTSFNAKGNGGIGNKNADESWIFDDPDLSRFLLKQIQPRWEPFDIGDSLTASVQFDTFFVKKRFGLAYGQISQPNRKALFE